MFQRLSDRKRIKIAKQIGREDVVKVMSRGGNHHILYVCLKNGDMICLFNDGTTKWSEHKWK